MRWPGALRARLRLLFGRRAAESRMEEEIRFHLEMEEERLIREEGLDPKEARRRARVTFGGVERTKEEMREGRGLAWLSGLRLDFKLGARMLLKYPILTAASVLALAVALALAASWFEFMTTTVRPRLPLPDGDRIVTVVNRDLETASVELRSLHDFETWREEAGALVDVSAGSPLAQTMVTESGRTATVGGMRVTSSLFRLARVQPLLGRYLIPADYEAGAEHVIVIGHELWQRLFDGDPSAVGATVRLGGTPATVVGVMPERFGFPVNEEVWAPLRESALDYERREGPPIITYARLAPGATIEEARAELAVIGQRTAAEFPTTHERLRPDANIFGRGTDMAGPTALLNLPFLFFLIVVSANVATLLFARTATREAEIAMRSALGASRRRIVLQLMAESLVLTLAAAALGVAVAHFGLRWGMDVFWEVQQTRPPFWFRSGLSWTSAAYAALLAVLGAVIIGGIPGLRAARRQLRQSLPQAGGAGMRFGRVATGVIILQVALCVAFIPFAIMEGKGALEAQETTDFPAEDYLTGMVARPSGHVNIAAAPGSRASDDGRSSAPDVLDEIRRRLAAEPGVLAATRASRLPGINHGLRPIELEGDTAQIVQVREVAVDPDFFEVLGARVNAGRGFREEDVTGGHRVAILDEEWAAQVYGGRSAVGQRLRFPAHGSDDPGEWIEVVGTVEGMDDEALGPGSTVGLYLPLKAEEFTAVQVYLRTTGDPDALVARVHSAITGVDPDLGVVDLMPLDQVWRPIERSQVFFIVAFGVIGAIILLFAMIGIYALMSFTVAQRTREIGVRAALGAEPRRIVVSIFSRAIAQIGLGVIAGATLISLTAAGDPEGLRLVAAVAAAMMLVGMMGCVLPARRALRIHPTEALRAE